MADAARFNAGATNLEIDRVTEFMVSWGGLVLGVRAGLQEDGLAVFDLQFMRTDHAQK
jgi:hypothetical protein